MSFMITSLLVDCLIAGRYLLHSPAVAVRIAEEDEPHVVESLPSTSQARRIPVQHLDFTDLHPSLDELRTRRMDVRDDQLQALEQAWLHVHDPVTQDDRAARPWRGQLDDATLIRDPGVVVPVEA